MKRDLRAHALLPLIAFVLTAASCTTAKNAKPAAPVQQVKASVNWDKVLTVSEATPTVQVVVNPPLRRSSDIHDPVFKALHDLGADYVRYVPWLPYPKLGVVDQTTNFQPPGEARLNGNRLKLSGFEVAVVSLPR